MKNKKTSAQAFRKLSEKNPNLFKHMELKRTSNYILFVQKQPKEIDDLLLKF